jgi:circadian clock protein KaiC
MVGGNMRSPIDTTYLADNVILFRYFEAHGHVRRAISVVKKRSGHHELTIREMQMSNRGLEIGEPLKDFQGILTGTPLYSGPSAVLQTARDTEEQSQRRLPQVDGPIEPPHKRNRDAR